MATRKPVPPKPPRAARKRAVPPGSAPVPVDDSLEALRDAAAGCKRCDLWKPATQTVFGAGPDKARILLVGEQPGDAEDLAGLPFVGPAGGMLDRALEELGLDRRRGPRGRGHAGAVAGLRLTLLLERWSLRQCLGASSAGPRNSRQPPGPMHLQWQ